MKVVHKHNRSYSCSSKVREKSSYTKEVDYWDFWQQRCDDYINQIMSLSYVKNLKRPFRSWSFYYGFSQIFHQFSYSTYLFSYFLSDLLFLLVFYSPVQTIFQVRFCFNGCYYVLSNTFIAESLEWLICWDLEFLKIMKYGFKMVISMSILSLESMITS